MKRLVGFLITVILVVFCLNVFFAQNVKAASAKETLKTIYNSTDFATEFDVTYKNPDIPYDDYLQLMVVNRGLEAFRTYLCDEIDNADSFEVNGNMYIYEYTIQGQSVVERYEILINSNMKIVEMKMYNNGIHIYTYHSKSEEPDPEDPKKQLESTGMDASYMAYLMKLLKADTGKKETPAKEIIDRDIFKSEDPAHTVIASEAATDAFGLFDLKVHNPDEKSTANQAFLAKTMVGPKVQILLTQNIYSRRDLSIAENGSLQTLTWNNLPKNQPGPVYAVVYNQIDGAYEINGILDANGTATFTGFKLRPASTITICK